MAKHGYCKNCWWWLCTCKGLIIGRCYIHNSNETNGYSYCKDYINRNKEKIDLTDWLLEKKLIKISE